MGIICVNIHLKKYWKNSYQMPALKVTHAAERSATELCQISQYRHQGTGTDTATIWAYRTFSTSIYLLPNQGDMHGVDVGIHSWWIYLTAGNDDEGGKIKLPRFTHISKTNNCVATAWTQLLR